MSDDELRLFIGIETGARVAQGAGLLLEALRARVRETAPQARLTWIAPERLHVTVRFIGETDDPTLRAIETALSRPLGVPAFDLEIRGIGVFPPRGRPRVVWAGVTTGRDAIVAVAREIAARLDPILGPDEERGFIPHVTLARVRDAAGLSRRFAEGLEAVPFGGTRVEAATLFESRLSPRGPAYVPLRRLVLAARPVRVSRADCAS